MKEEYYLGLDVGTGSVGWAVTNQNYEILRAHGKSLWGSRLFETAIPAEGRRTFRTTRRRLGRRNWRIQLLQELFAEEISKVDLGFFHRMKESRYVPEDKLDLNGGKPDLPYSLFVDKDFNDKDYYKLYPTIYHLRKMLMETNDIPDIRLVYLALHHFIKHRGHFLLSGDIENVREFKNVFTSFLDVIYSEELDFNIDFNEGHISYIELILKDKELGKNNKKIKMNKTFGAKTKCEKAIFNLLSGGKVKLSDLFDNKDFDESERPSISFSDSNYDEYESVIEDILLERYSVIEAAKAVYDWSILIDILGDSKSISSAKIAIYEKHKNDLKYLKEIVKNNLSKEDYDLVFNLSKDKVCNYTAYIGMAKHNGKKVDVETKKCSYGDFKKFLNKNVVEKINNHTITQYLEAELEKETFLPKQVNESNGVIPYQIHLYELIKILDNLEDKLVFIKENREKIVQLFKFRIPYYVGPLGVNQVLHDSDKFSWAVRRTNEKVTPWNFEDVIDVESSAEKFIRRMTNKCTYLYGEDVLPKESLLYSKFVVLNELNNLKLDGHKIDVALKQRIYNDLFCKTRKVTQKKLIKYLLKEGIVKKDVEISGIDGDFKGSLTAYHDFKEKLTDVELSKKDKEKIILNITLFGDDKKLLKRRLGKMYPALTERQLNSICSLSYKGWGRLSNRFLQELVSPSLETGEMLNIISMMWETNNNLMQLLSNDYDYLRLIEQFNCDDKKILNYQLVEEMYVSPSVKRQIWQTIKIIKELQGVMGCDPKCVFIEMAREKGDSKRSDSRKKQLIDLYKSCKKEERNWISELEEFENQKLRSDKLYLYYVQKGRCMYTGKPISLDELWNNTKYDIDHIYPQSKTMDDSLDNRVLVDKTFNNKIKKDVYPIDANTRRKMTPFWKSLLDGGFISKTKYERLVRSTELDVNELSGFIQRQIVETRQATKAVAEIFKRALPNSEIVYSKAGNVSRFRQDFKLIKVRDMNDLHHAKDAYLNIVVGNTYFVKFTKNVANFIKENPDRSYNLKRMFTSKDVSRGKNVAWVAGDSGTIKTVKKYMNKNDILVTRLSYEAKGGLFDQQLMKKGKGQVPVKGSNFRLTDINKYGGYNKATGAYFMLVKSKDKKGNEIRTIEYIPLYLKNVLENDLEYCVQYLKADRGLIDPEILIPKIKIDTLFELDGFKMWLSGRTENRLIFKCANQLLLDKENTIVLKKVIKYCNRLKEVKDLKIVDSDDIVDDELINLYSVFIDKLEKTVYKIMLSSQGETLKNNKDKFISLTMEEKCIVLSEILNLFQCNSKTANIELLNRKKGVGSIKITNNITRQKNIFLINQSITGIYEKKIDLLKV